MVTPPPSDGEEKRCLRCHWKKEDEAAHPPPPPSTPPSVISSCTACDVLPSICLYRRLAGRRLRPLRAGFICFSSSTPAAEDHIISASIRTPPGAGEGVWGERERPYC
ncbi:unnamed protein product [Pleuronectes platessa]|uniref:Uncharacterized protein n=1 Tax=Pleuronectes platessa TaxID=8262 RepID=A0A9N7U2P5_PLEPL|nr:unnamed protein product [Pleuronectes platessa]